MRLTLAVIVIALGGTANAQHSAPPILPDHPKLDIDPTETLPISGWWANGKEILFVREDGAFTWWDQPNRFRPATKTGRWDRQSYRTFWLEPYIDRKNTQQKPPRLRGAMRRADGVVFVTFDNYATFRQCDAAPLAPEDSYVGTWTGPGGSITLMHDATYLLVSNAASSDNAPPVSRSGHSGTWTFDGKYIILRAAGSKNDLTTELVICTVVDRPAEGLTAEKANVEALTTPLGELRRIKLPVSPVPTAAK
ncbi:MAG: hypothetical protein EXS17_03265 [Phycisphaerales bacterium]|nr:hypothetical protein [Phycisphaerales bacterium]